MIQKVDADTLALFCQRAKQVEGLGDLFWVNSQLFYQKQAWFGFYLTETGALMLREQVGYLLGQADPEELALLLEFAGVNCLIGKIAPPLGWEKQEDCLLMQYCPPTPEYCLALPDGVWLEPMPSPAHLVEMLKTEGLAEYQQENLYSELCTKCNHGKANSWIAHQNHQKVATITATALTQQGVYLAELLTLPSFRGKGIGTALCQQVAHGYFMQGKQVYLLCHTDKQALYQKAGFVTKDCFYKLCKREDETR